MTAAGRSGAGEPRRGFDPALVEFLEGGCALIVGSVDADGTPHASRGWGLTVLTAEDQQARLLLPRDDPAVTHLAEGGAVAVTGADVRTLSSVQLKGRSLGIEATTASDEARAGRYIDAFFDDVETTDGTPRPVLDRLVPTGYVAVLVEFDECYDQTPGPGAGRTLERTE